MSEKERRECEHEHEPGEDEGEAADERAGPAADS
jgi:hypothetical protein